jgi:hypothetical protein
LGGAGLVVVEGEDTKLQLRFGALTAINIIEELQEL